MKLEINNVVVIGNELAFLFSNAKEIYLPLDFLRKACPCATCKGEPDVLGRFNMNELQYKSNSFDLVSFQIIGGYALQIFWGDGHSTGIFAYDYLISLQTRLDSKAY
jgi:DUF971 family protein